MSDALFRYEDNFLKRNLYGTLLPCTVLRPYARHYTRAWHRVKLLRLNPLRPKYEPKERQHLVPNPVTRCRQCRYHIVTGGDEYTSCPDIRFIRKTRRRRRVLDVTPYITVRPQPSLLRPQLVRLLNSKD